MFITMLEQLIFRNYGVAYDASSNFYEIMKEAYHNFMTETINQLDVVKVKGFNAQGKVTEIEVTIPHEERVDNYYAAKHKAGFFINKLHQEGFQVFSNQRENITSLFMN